MVMLWSITEHRLLESSGPDFEFWLCIWLVNWSLWVWALFISTPGKMKATSYYFWGDLMKGKTLTTVPKKKKKRLGNNKCAHPFFCITLQCNCWLSPVSPLNYELLKGKYWILPSSCCQSPSDSYKVGTKCIFVESNWDKHNSIYFHGIWQVLEKSYVQREEKEQRGKMKSKGHISLENSPGCPQLISKYSLGTFVQPVLSHSNYTDFFFQSTNMLCGNVLNVLM